MELFLNHPHYFPVYSLRKNIYTRKRYIYIDAYNPDIIFNQMFVFKIQWEA